MSTSRGEDNLLSSSSSKVILRSYTTNIEILDFGDIGRSLASKLSDDDVYAILVCIDAHKSMKALRLKLYV